MKEIGWGMHVVIIIAMVIDLWVGGSLLQRWLGHGRLGEVVRATFEFSLIGWYLIVVVGMRAPLPWRRGTSDGRSDSRDDRGS